MKRWLLLLLLFIGALGWTGLMGVDFQRQQGTPASDGSSAEITYFDYDQSDFEEVTVYLSVLDESGQPVEGLTEDDFSVAEDGVAARITDFIPGGAQPVTAIMLIDRSGSMDDDAKISDAKEAALTFLEQLHNGRDRLGVLSFNDEFEVLARLQSVDDGLRSDLRSQIEDLSASGGTAYYDTIYRAVELLRGTSGRKVVLALTDGIDEDSSRDVDDVIEQAQDYRAALHTIGLGSDVERQALRQMARETDGQYCEEPSSSELAELYADLAEGLQDEYSLAYESPTPRLDGTTRQVEVTAQLPAGTVTAVGEYAVGGTFSPSLNLWPCLGALPLLVLLALPGLYDRVRRRGQLVEEGPASPQPVTPLSAPAPSASPRSGTEVMDEAAWAPPPPTAPTACASCGKELRPGARFCPACGEPVTAEEPESRCSNCGTSLRSEARFCPSCGQPMEEVSVGLICSHCGARLQPGAQFCANCGRGV